MGIDRPQIGRETMVVLYDERTGEVVHEHEVVTMDGASHPDERSMEADARAELERARSEMVKVRPAVRGRSDERIAALHVDPARVKPGATYRVDVVKRSLVEQ